MKLAYAKVIKTFPLFYMLYGLSFYVRSRIHLKLVFVYRGGGCDFVPHTQLFQHLLEIIFLSPLYCRSA